LHAGRSRDALHCSLATDILCILKYTNGAQSAS